MVTNERGRYNFPKGRLEPGQYTLTIRRGRIRHGRPGPIAVATGKAATADIKLHKAKDLSEQLTNAEWMMSAPGKDEQKVFLLG